MRSLIDSINQLKKQRNAIILAHNYQPADVQDLADFVGDSLGLSIQAAKTKAELIVFCGVKFMAETAKVLSPEKIVVMPDQNAGCPMADMINEEQLIAIKKQHPKAKVVCYVNSSVEVKAQSDICCTSANAVPVVRSIKDAKDIIFVPDKFLGHYVSTKCPEYKFIFGQGYCPIHANILPEFIIKAKQAHPQALVMVHPECRPQTIALADAVLSTSAMQKFAKESLAMEFIVATEVNMLYSLAKQNPNKHFYAAKLDAQCQNMKKTDLLKILEALQSDGPGITVATDVADKARKAIEKMLAIGRND